MSLEEAINSGISAIPECVAGGYVDMSTGLLLAFKTIDSHPQEILDFLAAATADLFQGENVVTIEKMFRKHRGQSQDGDHYFKEMLIFSDNLLHIFQRSNSHPEHAIIWVCNTSANLGMALTKARMHIPKVEASL